MARSFQNISGSVFFSAKTLKNNPLAVSESIKMMFRNPAIVPTMLWKDSTPPATPTNVMAQLQSNNKINLSWSYTNISDSEFDRAKKFIVYRFENGEAVVGNNSQKIRAVLPHLSNSQTVTFIDSEAQAGVNYKYVVTALDRLSNESGPSAAVSPTVLTAILPKETTQTAAVKPESIDNNFQVFPNPFNKQMSIRYKLAKNSNVSLCVYDQQGTRVGVLVNDEQKPEGTYSVVFNGEFLSDGVYFARLSTGNDIKTAKIVLAR
jgi:predicted Fe-Mo cluster-binding NifX family protein